MKIHRGGENNAAWTQTDEKRPESIEAYWHPKRSFIFSGAVNKSAQRKTAIGVTIEEADILALHAALLEHYSKRSKERDQFEGRVCDLKSAMSEIHWLIASSPDVRPEELLAEIGAIAKHCSTASPTSYKSKRKWGS